MIVALPYPPSTNRMWRNYRNAVVLSAVGKSYKQAAALLAKSAGMKPVDYDVAVVVTLHPKTNKDGSECGVVIDLDNSLKVALDSLQGVGYVNDKQIKRLAAAYGAPMKDGGLTVAVMAAEDMKVTVQ